MASPLDAGTRTKFPNVTTTKSPDSEVHNCIQHCSPTLAMHLKVARWRKHTSWKAQILEYWTKHIFSLSPWNEWTFFGPFTFSVPLIRCIRWSEQMWVLVGDYQFLRDNLNVKIFRKVIDRTGKARRKFACLRLAKMSFVCSAQCTKSKFSNSFSIGPHLKSNAPPQSHKLLENDHKPEWFGQTCNQDTTTPSKKTATITRAQILSIWNTEVAWPVDRSGDFSDLPHRQWSAKESNWTAILELTNLRTWVHAAVVIRCRARKPTMKQISNRTTWWQQKSCCHLHHVVLRRTFALCHFNRQAQHVCVLQDIYVAAQLHPWAGSRHVAPWMGRLPRCVLITQSITISIQVPFTEPTSSNDPSGGKYGPNLRLFIMQIAPSGPFHQWINGV